MHILTRKIVPPGFYGSKIGLEKEGLRVTRNGGLSQARHPENLGSALTNPCITTDFSESQLELITPPCPVSDAAIQRLLEIETFTQQHIGEELIWSSSMPCRIENDTEIKVAEYGNSAKGLKKTIYRRGLAHRYGKPMQIISGVHFNHSFSEKFWELLQKQYGHTQPIVEFINDRYMQAIRNIQRIDWLLVYLFGASPAVDRSFPAPKDKLQAYDKETCFLPYATSLRMSDFGYSNNFEHYTESRVRYDSLHHYISSLEQIISATHPLFSTIPLLADGKQQQLNHNLLQIENEHYVSVRPKQTPLNAESALQALEKRGIAYIEIRSLDINPFEASGIELQQLHFLEIFMHHCLLNPSTEASQNQSADNAHNLKLTATQGRKPSLQLIRNGKTILLNDWAESLFSDMQWIARKLDQDNDCDHYSRSLMHYHRFLKHPERTPSARILSEMATRKESFIEFTQRQSLHNHQYFMSRPMHKNRLRYYAALSRLSILEQTQLESSNENPCRNHSDHPLCRSA